MDGSVSIEVEGVVSECAPGSFDRSDSSPIDILVMSEDKKEEDEQIGFNHLSC